jgi:hypothetical protein
MLGLVREGEGIAAQVLSNMGIDLKRARKEVFTCLAVKRERSEQPKARRPARRPQRLILSAAI